MLNHMGSEVLECSVVDLGLRECHEVRFEVRIDRRLCRVRRLRLGLDTLLPMRRFAWAGGRCGLVRAENL